MEELLLNKSSDIKTNPSISVFNGSKHHFPSAVFTDLQLAKAWIQSHKLTGTLTAYPLSVGGYDWAISQGYFTPKSTEQTIASFIANFSSASQEHYHFEEGEA